MSRKRLAYLLAFVPLTPVIAQQDNGKEPPAGEVRLITLDPGHFHAALLQKQMLPGFSRLVQIYAPLGPDLIAHLGRIAQFNSRAQDPTNWDLDIYAGPDFLERMLRERRGNVVVLSGRNRGKIDRIQACLAAGFHVLADKPWIVEASDLPKLEVALDTAERQGLVAYDIMTERFEITSILQRELVNDPATFGAVVAGTNEQPGVHMESVHYLLKTVAGMPNLRPAWFFDISEQGEGLSDIGTHLVDLVQWTLFPEQPLDYRRDIHIVGAKRWPTALTKAEFQRVTGEPEIPEYLRAHMNAGRLEYFCNNLVSYTVKGVHTKLDVRWDFEAPVGMGDTYRMVFRGARSRVEVRQGKEQEYRPELYIVPVSPVAKAEVLAALKRKVAALQPRFQGIAVVDRGDEMLVTIPDRYRVGHEAHFALVANQFLAYLKNPKSLPSWEKADMLAKYYVTTRGVERARRAEDR